jgi:hypothetical protein
MARAKMSTACFPPGAEPKGATQFERFDNIMKRILSASKEDVDRRMAEHWKRHHKKKRKKSS